VIVAELCLALEELLDQRRSDPVFRMALGLEGDSAL